MGKSRFCDSGTLVEGRTLSTNIMLPGNMKQVSLSADGLRRGLAELGWLAGWYESLSGRSWLASLVCGFSKMGGPVSGTTTGSA